MKECGSEELRSEKRRSEGIKNELHSTDIFVSVE